MRQSALSGNGTMGEAIFLAYVARQALSTALVAQRLSFPLASCSSDHVAIQARREARKTARRSLRVRIHDR